jgi:hypothetical protein
MNNKIKPIIQNHSQYNEDALKKIETCKFRSKDLIFKQSCCSSGYTNAFKCNLKNIYPLSFSEHCKDCPDYINTAPVSSS